MILPIVVAGIVAGSLVTSGVVVHPQNPQLGDVLIGAGVGTIVGGGIGTAAGVGFSVATGATVGGVVGGVGGAIVPYAVRDARGNPVYYNSVGYRYPGTPVGSDFSTVQPN